MRDALMGWPGWEGLHPLWVHFPVAWLLTLPLLLVPALVLSPPRARRLLLAAFWLAVFASGATWAARATGKASAAGIVLPPGGELQLARHQELGEALVASAWGLAAVLGAILFWRPLSSRFGGARRLALVVALAAALLVALLAAATAHAGGRLVHELGVRVWAPADSPRR